MTAFDMQHKLTPLGYHRPECRECGALLVTPDDIPRDAKANLVISSGDLCPLELGEWRKAHDSFCMTCVGDDPTLSRTYVAEKYRTWHTAREKREAERLRKWNALVNGADRHGPPAQQLCPTKER